MPKLCPLRRFARFTADRCGVAGIEFALIGGAVIVALLAVFDIGLLLFNGANLHQALNEATRELRIEAGNDAAAERNAFDAVLCAKLVLIACDDVQVDLRGYDDLASIGTPVGIDAGGNLASPQFQPVDPGQLVFVTALTHHPMLTPLGILLRSAAYPALGNKRLLRTTVLTAAESA